MASKLLVLASLAFYSILVSAEPSLFLNLKGPIIVDGTDHLYIITTLVNTGNETLNILKDPRTAMTSTPTDIFGITNVNGTIPDFIGSIVCNPEEAATADINMDHFASLKSGGSFNITHHLGQAYNFTNTGPGTYYVRSAQDTFQYLHLENGILVSLQAQSDFHVVEVAGPIRQRVVKN